MINMPPKKRIIRVCFGDSSLTADPASTLLPPTSRAATSNMSTPITPNPQIPTFDSTIGNCLANL